MDPSDLSLHFLRWKLYVAFMESLTVALRLVNNLQNKFNFFCNYLHTNSYHLESISCHLHYLHTFRNLILFQSLPSTSDFQPCSTHGTLNKTVKLSRHTISFLRRDFIIKVMSIKILFKSSIAKILIIVLVLKIISKFV
jgi:predicted phosphoadenosine phosphosulfate sulfurtransferase